MPRSRKSRGFALYEVLIGMTIFIVGIVALGRSVQNCLNASSLSAEEDRVRQFLSNRMAEVQATPGVPDAAREIRVESGYGPVRILQKTVTAGLKDAKNTELSTLHRVSLTAKWSRGGTVQSKEIEFYVYRAG